MISLKVHNILDYVIGAILVITPWLFRFADIPVARNFFLFAGIALIAYSMVTNYYYSVARVLPLGVHMTLDAALGVLTILAPVLFGYRDLLTGGQYAVHVVLGLGAIGLVAVTRPLTEAAKTPAERMAITHDVPIPH